jgi:hypothetical protein
VPTNREGVVFSVLYALKEHGPSAETLCNLGEQALASEYLPAVAAGGIIAASLAAVYASEKVAARYLNRYRSQPAEAEVIEAPVSGGRKTVRDLVREAEVLAQSIDADLQILEDTLKDTLRLRQ